MVHIMETGAEQIWSQILVVCFTFVQQHIRSNDPFMSFFIYGDAVPDAIVLGVHMRQAYGGRKISSMCVKDSFWCK